MPPSGVITEEPTDRNPPSLRHLIPQARLKGKPIPSPGELLAVQTINKIMSVLPTYKKQNIATPLIIVFPSKSDKKKMKHSAFLVRAGLLRGGLSCSRSIGFVA